MAGDRSGRQRSSGQLDHEGCLTGEDRILPTGDAPWKRSEVYERKTDQTRVAPLYRPITHGVVNQTLVLVVPDGYRRVQALYQLDDGARFRFG